MLKEKSGKFRQKIGRKSWKTNSTHFSIRIVRLETITFFLARFLVSKNFLLTNFNFFISSDGWSNIPLLFSRHPPFLAPLSKL